MDKNNYCIENVLTYVVTSYLMQNITDLLHF
jgi:hypothetical protein